MIDQNKKKESNSFGEYTYTVTKAKEEKKNGLYHKNVLVVTNTSAIVEEDGKCDQNSAYQMRPKTSNNVLKEDFVELPKINFSYVSPQDRSRKGSDVNIKLPDLEGDEEAGNKKTHALPSEECDSDYYEEIEEEKSQYAGWNIKNIIITPSRDNYLESDYALLPETAADKRKRARKNSREIEREMQRRQRERNLEMVSNFLSGKASVIWLFVLGLQIDQEEINKVQSIYSQYTQNDYEVPICRSYEEACKFLKLQNCFFKIVVDLSSSPKFLEDSELNKNIVAIYIYNPQKIDGINRAFELKKNTKKIKGMYNNLDDVTKQAQIQIENEAKFVKVGEDIEREKNKLRFPSFIILSGADTTEVTNYRLCLFGAIKLSQRREREAYLKQFTDMVELRYKGVQKELDHLKQYMAIDHLGQNTEQKMKEVLQFYVRETFYYVLTNSILRLSRTAEEFRPCTIPFNETYHAIKHYYKKYRLETKNKKKQIVVYRGAKLRNSDVKALAVGSYIELLGFTSTSLKRSEAEKFMDGDSFLFEIIIEKGEDNQEDLTYDHGFVEMNRYNLAAKAFQKEEEILINALNIFQVSAIDLDSATRKITLKYGAILPLLKAKSKDLNPTDRAVVQNYKYCLETYKSIEDDGDVLLIAQQHDRCVEYYQNKIEGGESDFKIFSKLAYAQLQCGDLQQAYNNALKSLEHLEDTSKNNQEIQKTVNQMKKNIQVFNVREDYLHYHNSIDICLQMMKDDWLESVKMLKTKAQKRLKGGDLAGCEEDINMARALIKDKAQSFEARRKQIQKRYYIRSLCCACSQNASSQLEDQKEFQLLKIQQDELQFERRKEEIHQVSIEIQNLAKELAQERCDEEQYKKCVQNSQKHFMEMEKQPLNPIIQAKYQALEASVVNKHQNLPEFENKMEIAIRTVKKHDPMHKDIGAYNNILGSERQAAIKRKLHLPPINPGALSSNQMLEPSDHVPISVDRSPTERYNYQQHEQMTVKCKQALKEAAENIAYNAGKESPDYLSVRNKLTELDFDSSKLGESQRIANETKEFKLVRFHSEGARCYLLLTKISLAKGQLKKAFENVESSLQILRNTLLKVDNKAYNTILISNPLYIEINLHRAKIYNRQLKHDLALKELRILKKVAEIRRDKHHSSSVLASVFEEEAQIQLCTGQTDQFQEKILEAIAIRQTQIGRYNIPNAIAYSNLFKFMFSCNDIDTALMYHLKATEIFSRFPNDHPNFWVIHLSNAMIYFKKNEIDKCIDQLQNCLRVTNFRYSPNHIITLKIDYQYAQMLKKMKKVDQAAEMFRLCEDVLVRCLKEKESMGEKVRKETDDEKIPLLKNVYKELRDIHTQKNGQLQERDLASIIQVEKYNKNLQDMEQMLSSASSADLVQQ